MLPPTSHADKDAGRRNHWPRSPVANVLLIIVLAPFLFFVAGSILSVTSILRISASEDLSSIKFAENASQNDLSSFDWESITPTKAIVYQPCYGRFRCARLLLPMDWLANSTSETLWNHTVAIAMIKLPANVSSVLDARYGGEVYINPGGPGGSGVSIAQRGGPLIQSIVSSEDPDGKVYDVVSFDPRGVRFSTPRISCFDTLADQTAWYDLHATYGGVDSADRAMATLWARAHALGAACDPVSLPGQEPKDSEDNLLKYHVSTTVVARDIVEIIERSGELREKLAREALRSARLSSIEQEERLHALRWRRGEEKLQYWGFSYGSVLGGFFATLYPSRVGRMVLDGGGNYNDWISGEWKTFLDHTEQGLRWLYRDCYAAGAGNCSLYNPDGPYVLEGAVTDFLDELYNMPILVPDAAGGQPDILTYEDVITALFMSLYSPYTAFVNVANALSSLMLDRSNTTAARAILSKPRVGGLCGSSDACTNDKCILDQNALSHMDAEMAIGCSDGPDLRGETLSAFAGPFGGPTAHPLLFVSNDADPVSPREGVAAMAAVFEGAGLIRIESPGHCSISTPSSCAFANIRAYFQGDEGPAAETVCGVDYQPFLAGGRTPRLTGEASHLQDLAAEIVDAQLVERGFI